MFTAHLLCPRLPPGTFISIIKLTHHDNLPGQATYLYFSDEETEAQVVARSLLKIHFLSEKKKI